jgi:gliding motility-associated-like protein
MFLRGSKYYYLLIISLLFATKSAAQLGGLGGPLFNITFGDAPTGSLSIPGPPLQQGRTDIPYTTDVCPPPGSYTVVSGLTATCFDSAWIPLFGDNTPFPDNNGYMMLINDIPYSSPKTVFEYAVSGCPDVNYQFSAAIINVDRPNSGCTRFSSFTLQVEDNSGNIIASTTTGDIQFAVYNMGYHFNRYAVNFIMPAGSIAVVKIIDEVTALAPCSNGIAIDDIKVSVTGPKVNIGFDSTPIGDWVKSCCFQDNKVFVMGGTVDSGIVNPQVQWQQSTDDGKTWSDIPGATGYTYSQHFSVVDTFLFRLRASDPAHISFPDCGISSDRLRVQVDGLPTNYTITNNSPLCAGEQLRFNAAGAVSYVWTGPNGFYDNVSYPGIFHSSLKDSGTYYVEVSSIGGCRVTDSTHVVIIGTDVHAGNDTAICKGQSVSLRASNGATYTWSPSAGLSDAMIADPVAKPAETTVYTVLVTDNYGCSDTASIKISVINKTEVKAAIIASAYVCRSFDSLYFISNSSGTIKSWAWDFGNGQTSIAEIPPVQNYLVPLGTNSYLAKLTVTDTSGCSSVAYHTLTVVDNCYLAVPNAFTPNGDGLNDYLYPLNAYKAVTLSFMVFNRSGQKVFETKKWPDKWDGTFNGNPQSPGTYVWILNYTEATGKKILLKGSAVLIR